MNKVYLILIVALLAGCAEDDAWPRTGFELESGQIVQCRWVDETGCGLKLYDCADGRTYTCQVNVGEL